MNCELAPNLLSARLDGEIDDADRAALESHLAGCPACRAAADAMTTQDAVLTSAFNERLRAADLLADRVIAQFRTQSATEPDKTKHRRILPASDPSLAAAATRRWWTNWGRPLVAAAAGFSLAILLTRLWDKPDNTRLAIPPTNTTATQSTVATQRAVPSMAQLALATGAVFVCPSDSDQWRPLESGGAVQVGMKVRTGPKVRCEFKLNDGSEVRMNADTQITLTATRRVEVAGGQVYSSVRKQDGNEPFIVKTSPAQATLTALGTAFDVTCTPAKTTCTVVEGSVKMEAGDKQDVVRGGETLTLADGNFGGKKQVENLMQATQWVDEILVLKGRDNPELAGRINDIFAQLGHDKMWYMHAQEVRRLGDHCIVPLTRYIQSDRSKATQDDEMKRREAARIVGDVATTWAIPELINLLADTDGDVRYAAATALQRLTGQSQGRRPEEWRDQGLMACTPTVDKWHGWWEQNKSRFPGADPDAVKPVELVAPKGKG